MMRILKHPVLIYGISLAALVFLMQYLEYFHLVRKISTEFYIIVLAVMFTVLGLWMGRKISGKRPATTIEINRKAIKTLRLSKRELEVLGLMAKGYSNEEIGEKLFISLSTVKSHASNLFQKLEVDNRVKAIKKAISLKLIKE